MIKIVKLIPIVPSTDVGSVIFFENTNRIGSKKHLEDRELWLGTERHISFFMI